MKYNDEYWKDRLDSEPERVKKAIKRVYEAYPKNCLPQGLCDPMYIMNVIAVETGAGDGCGKFYPPASELMAALQGLFEHCAMIHKNWGSSSNQRESTEAIETAKALLEKGE